MNRNNIWVAGPETINKTNINGKRGQQERSGVLSYLIMIWDHTQYQTTVYGTIRKGSH